jgi:hypothetical protein
MVSRAFTVVLILVVLAECQGADRGGVRSYVGAPPVMAIVTTAQLSGSLEYWGRCDVSTLPDFPKVRDHRQGSESPIQALREVFADDPEMRVTQEPNGMIRMAETDVPSDLLNVRISHISFEVDPKHPGGLGDILWDPRGALLRILSTPEVVAFRRARDIGPFEPEWLFGSFANPSPKLPRISGDLNDVTLSQALDYVLRTFPGLWIYENCASQKYKREVFFAFYQNSPMWTAPIKRQMPGR